jgi:terminase small subunit-like protein
MVSITRPSIALSTAAVLVLASSSSSTIGTEPPLPITVVTTLVNDTRGGYGRRSVGIIYNSEAGGIGLRGVERAELSAARTLEEARRNAFSDIGALFDEQGRLKPLHTLPAEVRSTIASVEVIVKNAAGGDGHTDVVHKVRLWSKDKALELLAKHFSLLVNRVKLETDDALLKLLDEGRKRNAEGKG